MRGASLDGTGWRCLFGINTEPDYRRDERDAPETTHLSPPPPTPPRREDQLPMASPRPLQPPRDCTIFCETHSHSLLVSVSFSFTHIDSGKQLILECGLEWGNDKKICTSVMDNEMHNIVIYCISWEIGTPSGVPASQIATPCNEASLPPSRRDPWHENFPALRVNANKAGNSKNRKQMYTEDKGSDKGKMKK